MADYHNISILQHIRKKYNIPYLEEAVSIFFISLITACIIFLSMKYEVIQMTMVIFILLLIVIFVVNQYYKKKYVEKVETINEKMKSIGELIEIIYKKQTIGSEESMS